MFILVHRAHGSSTNLRDEVIINVNHIRYLHSVYATSSYPMACEIHLTSNVNSDLSIICRETYEEIREKMLDIANRMSSDNNRFELMDFE